MVHLFRMIFHHCINQYVYLSMTYWKKEEEEEAMNVAS